MEKMLFMIRLGLGDSGSATRAMQFAALCADAGADVEVVLVDDAVHWAQFGMAEGIRSTTGEQMLEMLGKLTGKGCMIHVCKACADKRLLGEDEIIPGSRITSGPDIAKMMVVPGTKVVTF
jgi:uncharacterized protein involved in oxidation of intracellular sulfur